MFRISILLFLGIFVFGGVTQAADLMQLQDKFYGGVANILEANMDYPVQCLSEIDRYFRENQALLEQLREETKKALTEAAPMMQEMIEKYQSMTEEELRAMEQDPEAAERASRERLSAGMKRYSEAMETFSRRHPQYAMELAGKMMQVIMEPGHKMPMHQDY